MSLLVQTLKQVAVILLAANAMVLATERFGLGANGWWIVDILLVALGVFSIRLYQETMFAAWRADEPPDGPSAGT